MAFNTYTVLFIIREDILCRAAECVEEKKLKTEFMKTLLSEHKIYWLSNVMISQDVSIEYFFIINILLIVAIYFVKLALHTRK